MVSGLLSFLDNKNLNEDVFFFRSGEDKISISGVVKFVQLAYNYESWEVFESLVQPIINCLRPLTNNEKHFVEMKSLEVLQALLPINMNKFRKKVTLGMEEKDSSEAISTKHSSGSWNDL